MKKVVVYCSSQAGLPEVVIDGARKIGDVIGKCGAELVYGGVNAGLMHVVAQSAHDAGAKVCGVVPEFFSFRADAVCDELIKTQNLSERKNRMIELGDVFIVLPGGIGTIDEWISTLSDIMVREKTNTGRDRPILVWNHDGMYDGTVSQLSASTDSIYARGARIDRSVIFQTADQLALHLTQLLEI